MKQLILLFSIITLFTGCTNVKHTAYKIAIFNNSTTSILVEYETATTTNSVLLHNNLNQEGFWIDIYAESYLDQVLENYDKPTFESIIYSVKLSIVNDTDTIPLSKEFAPFDNWNYWEHYDDNIMEYDYRLTITDELLD